MFKTERHHRASLTNALAFTLAMSSAGLTIATPSIAVAAPENAKWFLLRDHTTGTCWPSVLISIDGDYQHAFAQKAGGPYNTEAQARARQRELKAIGTCQ